MIEIRRVRGYSPLPLNSLLTMAVPETILDKFPLSDIPPLGPVASDFEERLSRLKRVQQSMVPQELKPVDKFSNDVERPGDQYRRYRNVGDIPEKAIPFFGLVGMFKL